MADGERIAYIEFASLIAHSSFVRIIERSEVVMSVFTGYDLMISFIFVCNLSGIAIIFSRSTVQSQPQFELYPQ